MPKIFGTKIKDPKNEPMYFNSLALKKGLTLID